MNNQYLSDFQLKQVRHVLKKYGTESDDLLKGLTEEYLIEFKKPHLA